MEKLNQLKTLKKIDNLATSSQKGAHFNGRTFNIFRNIEHLKTKGRNRTFI